MDDLIDNFFQSKYTEEARDLLYKASGIFSVFTFSEPFGEIVDLISMEGSIENDTLVDGVRGIFDRGVNRLLEANRVRVGVEVTFAERIRILEGIFAITKIEDPEPYLPLFDSWSSDEETFAKVLGIVLSEPYEEFFYQFTWVYEGTLKRLKEFLEDLKTENETVELGLLKDIRKNLRVFNKVFGSIPIIESLTEINFIKGQPFQSYLNIFREEIVDLSDMESTTYALIWLAIVSSDGYKNPKLLLMEEAKNLFLDIPFYNAFNSMCTKAFGMYLPALGVEQ